MIPVFEASGRPFRSGLEGATPAGRLLVLLAVLLALVGANVFLEIPLPGTGADVRPQIALILLVGYLCGPLSGFLVGFLGNTLSDLIMGYGFEFFPSWSVGNGLMGLVMGLFPQRMKSRLNDLGDLVRLLLFILGANLALVTYSGVSGGILDRNLEWPGSLQYVLLPELNSNLLASLLLVPATLYGLGCFRRSYSIKLALSLFYFSGLLLFLSWILLFAGTDGMGEVVGVGDDRALLDAFNRWTLLLVAVLLLALLAATFLSKAVTKPLSDLESAVVRLLRGDETLAQGEFDAMSGREDEVGLLGHAVGLLGERIWENQRLFKADFSRRMGFSGGEDRVEEEYLAGLASLLGRESVPRRDDSSAPSPPECLRGIDAISIAVTMGGLSELADTYSESKVEKSLAQDLVRDEDFSKEQLRRLAVAVDLNLIFRGMLRSTNLRDPLEADLAWHLLYRINTFFNREQNSIGYVTEPGIAARLMEAWERGEKVRTPELESVFDRAIAGKAITGYHIKRVRDFANFERRLKLSYSHSDTKHLKQLTGLLIGEHLQAKLQLEIKRSHFRYLPSWEKRSEALMEHGPGGVDILRNDEFDLVMEFTTPEGRDRFREIVERWVRRGGPGRPQVLYESWVQPLYFSETPGEGYHRVEDLMVRSGDYLVQTYVITGRIQEVQAHLQDLLEGGESRVRPLWVNDSFFRYLREYGG